jgi:hypothetical protein
MGRPLRQEYRSAICRSYYLSLVLDADFERRLNPNDNFALINFRTIYVTANIFVPSDTARFNCHYLLYYSYCDEYFLLLLALQRTSRAMSSNNWKQSYLQHFIVDEVSSLDNRCAGVRPHTASNGEPSCSLPPRCRNVSSCSAS